MLAMQEYEEYRKFIDTYGDVSKLPTREFIAPMKAGEEVTVDIEQGARVVLF